jgi:hypothetical protein
MTNFGEVLSSTALSHEVIIALENFRKGMTAPTDVGIGSTPGVIMFHFDAVAETISHALILPINMDKTIDPQIILVWSLTQTEVDGTDLSTTIDYTAAIEHSTGSGVDKTSTQLTDDMTVTTANGLAAQDIYAQAFTVDAEDATNPLANAAVLSFALHLTNITGVDSGNLVGACFAYERLH